MVLKFNNIRPQQILGPAIEHTKHAHNIVSLVHKSLVGFELVLLVKRLIQGANAAKDIGLKQAQTTFGLVRGHNVLFNLGKW